MRDQKLDALETLLANRPIAAARWGLERIQALLDELGRPEQTFDSFHIAGTNGKGSTAAFTEALLRASGARTGLYTSPHLADIRERFQIDARWIEREAIEDAAQRVLSCSSLEECTYFEATTALAFLLFARHDVDVGVIETGLGGRLDATNALVPVATAITPIGLDHMELLGSTLAEIAAEKAGILETMVPVSMGRIESEAAGVVEARAAELGAPVTCLGRDAFVEDVRVDLDGTRFRYRAPDRSGGLNLQTRLVGTHQADNAALALMMVDGSTYRTSGADAQTAMDGARIPGRFEVRREEDRLWVFDIAHNAEAISGLLGTIRALEPPRPLVTVVGVLADKDWRPMLEALALDSDAIILTQPTSAPDERRWDAATAAEWLSGVTESEVEVREVVEAALRTARERSLGGTVLVTGSAYTVGDARGIASPAVDDRER